MKKTIITVFIIYFIQGIIHNLGHPITVQYIEQLGMKGVMFGIFFALMSLGLALGGPFWGILGDKKNKKVLILIGLLIYSLGQFIFGNVHNVWIMSIMRFVSGFGVSASVTLLLSYLIEKSDTENRTRNIAFGAAMMALGASSGYWLGGQIPEFMPTVSFIIGSNYSLAVTQASSIFLIQAVLNVVYAFGVYFSLENCETNPDVKKETMFSSIKSIKKLDKNLIIFLFSLTLISMAAINISKFIEVYIGDAKNIGNFVAVTGIVGILTTIIIVPQIIKLKKDINIIILVTFLSGIVIFIVFRINNVMLSLYTLFMFYVMFKSIYAPLETSFISSHAGVGEYGKIMGIRQFFFAIGFVIGPLVGGLLLDINALYVFDLSVVLFLIGAILILIVRNNINKVIVIDKEQI